MPAKKNVAPKKSTKPKAAKAPVSKPKSKKKKTDWGGLLHSAAKLALDMAPMALPLLLGPQGHGPTKALAASKGAPTMGTTSMGVPLATGGSMNDLCGVKSLLASGRDARGNLKGMRVTTVDMIGAVPETGFSAGDIISQFFLHPQDPTLEGTKFSQFSVDFERYKFHKAVICFEPLCPATTLGGFTQVILDDPTFDVSDLAPTTRLKTLGGMTGAETHNVWEMGMCHLPPVSGQQALFTDPNGSDARLSIQGLYTLLAAADIAAGTTGNLYIICDVELQVPIQEQGYGAGASAVISDPSPNVGGGLRYDPYSSSVSQELALGGGHIELLGSWTESGTERSGNVLVGMHAGVYDFSVAQVGSFLAVALTGAFLTDEGSNLGVTLSGNSITNSSQTKSNQISTLTIPYDIPSDVPIVGFACDGSTLTSFTTKISQRVDFFDTVGGGVLSVSHKLWSRTMQGRNQRRDLKTTAMMKQIESMLRTERRIEKVLEPSSSTSAAATFTAGEPCPEPSAHRLSSGAVGVANPGCRPY